MVKEEGICWYAARTRAGQEIGIRSRLDSLGVENFIPSFYRQNYRGKPKEHPCINNLVFIRTTKTRACELKTSDGLPYSYVTDFTRHSMLVIPDKQMDDFIRVLTAPSPERTLMDQPVSHGEKVRVSRGPLKGVEGYVMQMEGSCYVVVEICGTIFAKAKVSSAWLERVGNIEEINRNY